jgi:hypothetical protein
MVIAAASIVAQRETYNESAAICRRSGLSVTIRLPACEKPSTISFTAGHHALSYNDWSVIVKNGGLSGIQEKG